MKQRGASVARPAHCSIGDRLQPAPCRRFVWARLREISLVSELREAPSYFLQGGPFLMAVFGRFGEVEALLGKQLVLVDVGHGAASAAAASHRELPGLSLVTLRQNLV